MNIILELFGEGKDLSIVQMSCRAIVIFFIALVLIRITGRRSFGMRTPFDNVITILLGAILSRAVVGASSFIPTVAACCIISILHRLLAWLCISYPSLANFIQGKKIPLYENGHLIEENMTRGLISKEDVLAQARLSIHMESLDKIEKCYLENNGHISIVKKND
jgi:uncharacterized membrane protein YcaP (DUF421 family)